MTVEAGRGEALVGLALTVFGVALGVLAWRMPAGSVSLPGPGFMPAALGVLLAFVGVGCVARALMANAPPRQIYVGGLKAWGALATLAAAAFLFEPLGAPLTLAVAMTALFRLTGGYSLVRGAAYGAAASIVAWVVFTRLLGVGLPPGVLPL
jgi:hypothetical protein